MYCNDILQLIENKLIPSSTDVNAEILSYIIKGDHYRYICEFSTGAMRDEAEKKAGEAYT